MLTSRSRRPACSAIRATTATISSSREWSHSSGRISPGAPEAASIVPCRRSADRPVEAGADHRLDVGERGGHPPADAAAGAGDQGDARGHESTPAVAAAVSSPRTVWTSGKVTVALSRERVIDHPGENRHSAITQRPLSTT